MGAADRGSAEEAGRQEMNKFLIVGALGLAILGLGATALYENRPEVMTPPARLDLPSQSEVGNGDGDAMDYVDVVGAYQEIAFYGFVLDSNRDRSQPFSIEVALDFETAIEQHLSMRDGGGRFMEFFRDEDIASVGDPSVILGPFEWAEGLVFESAEFNLIELACGVTVLGSMTLRSDQHVDVSPLRAEEVCVDQPPAIATKEKGPVVAVTGD